jgi:Coenzyme PQQ synthesis protein D (PqqD)
MDWDLRPLRMNDLEVSAVTDGFVVSRPGHDRIHFLNPTAAFILEICDGKLPARELPELVAAAFRLESPPVSDVETCLASLLQEGLVVEAGARARKPG